MFHLMNRGVKRHQLFADADEYEHFLGLMARAHARVPLRVIAYCLMPNHWHFVVWPRADDEVSAYMKWLTGTHSCHFNRSRASSGHVYQARFKSVAVQEDRHLLTLLRYVEGNALRARLVDRAELWPWSSLHSREHITLDPGPLRRPPCWLELLNYDGRPTMGSDPIAHNLIPSRGQTPSGPSNEPAWV